MATTYSGAFEQELRSLINQVIEQLSAQATAGTGLDDYASYKYLVGRIAGLREALDLFEAANDIMKDR
jgi:hypothetical protein